MFGGMFKKPKPREGSDEVAACCTVSEVVIQLWFALLADNFFFTHNTFVFQDKDSLSSELSAITDDLSENTKPKVSVS